MSDNELCPLGALVMLVNQAISAYQNSLAVGETELPPLQSAVFEFKTVAQKKGGFSIDLFIFKFGSSHEKDVTNDVTFRYDGTAIAIAQGAPPTQDNDLTATIRAAALAVVKSPTVSGLPFDQLTVNVQFGMTWEIDAGGTWTYSFVSVGLTGAKDKNTLQSVTLTFSGKLPSAAPLGREGE